ncbi:Vacuolar protein-sorting-associated protein 36 [Ophiocordyceps camponoti-floridani]|uniref:Vacuolar protein-sorting-associated protein 36 n=1 Tax=Ophiocordyceps camponoti-floridani TaxID=2030778 RepID=A0A8H4VE61_9HYPO|nr:Vacuolar protein-sorting-associated protein 36 [Ophiocordyceps camponoti-floridani]
MFLKHIDLTTALRPSYLPDEVLLFVQDNVGLYEGKLKLPDHQNGQVYLTSHRICYVDKAEPRANSVALELKHVDRFDLYAGFLKSSAKITLIPKPLKRSTLDPRAKLDAVSSSRAGSASPGLRDGAFRPPPGPPPLTTATWVCTICSFSNPTPVNFDPSAANAYTPLPPCLACGIKPTLSHVLKAAISNASNRTLPAPIPSLGSSPARNSPLAQQVAGTDPCTPMAASSSRTDAGTDFKCPRCTFSNHPSLLSCEMCGASLLSQPLVEQNSSARTQSPGPVREHRGPSTSSGIDASEGIKISFRSGGDKIFHERLKGAMTQRKWLLQNAPPCPGGSRRADEANADDSSDGASGGKLKTAGIAGLEQLGLNMRKNTELLIGSAFEDLEALMSSAKEVVALAERLARQNSGASAEENAILAESASQLGLVTTKDMVGGGGGSESLYLSELSRNVAEFLTDDSRGVLKKAGGIMTLVDLWAMFNRARGGVELVSPLDFEKAARLWEKLRLPVRLRTFRSGVMVVQAHDRTDETTIRALVAWLQDLHEFPPERETAWDWREFGRGVTAQEVAERFGWSMGVAEEELLMAEEHGALCRDEGLEGLKFWQNYIDTGEGVPPRSRASQDEETIINALRESGLY